LFTQEAVFARAGRFAKKAVSMILPIGDENIKGGHYPIVSYGLLALNIIIFFYQASMQPEALRDFVYTWGAVPAEISRGENLITLLTSMFLHGGAGHLIGNMLFLWIFGDNIEATIGNFRFLFFYLAGGLAAHALHIFLGGSSEMPTVGASGAISAVMGAYLVMYPRSQIKMLFFVFPFRISAWLFLGVWIWQQWMAGAATMRMDSSQVSGVAYWAHIGGFLFGVLLGFYFRYSYERPKRESEARRDGYV